MKTYSLLFSVLCTFLCFSQSDLQVEYTLQNSLHKKGKYLEGKGTIRVKNLSKNTLNHILFELPANEFADGNTFFDQKLLANNLVEYHYLRKKHMGGYDFCRFGKGEQEQKIPTDTVLNQYKFFLKKDLKPGQVVQIPVHFLLKIPLGTYYALGHRDGNFLLSNWFPIVAPYMDGKFKARTITDPVQMDYPAKYKFTFDKTESLTKLQTNTSLKQSNNQFSPVVLFSSSYSVQKHDINLSSGKLKLTHWKGSQRKFEYNFDVVSTIENALKHYESFLGPFPFKELYLMDNYISNGSFTQSNVVFIKRTSDYYEFKNALEFQLTQLWTQTKSSWNPKDQWVFQAISHYLHQTYISGSTNKVDLITDQKNFWKRLRHQYNMNNLTGLSELANRELAFKHKFRPIAKTKLSSAQQVNTRIKVQAVQNLIYLDQLSGRKLKSYITSHPTFSGKNFQKFCVTNTSLKTYKNLFSSRRELDIKIDSVSKKANSTVVKLQNDGGFSERVPYALVSKIGDTIKQGWLNAFSHDTLIEFETENIDKIILDPNNITPDINRANNVIFPNKLFKKPNKIRIYGHYRNPEKNKVLWSPIVSFNQSAGSLPIGMLFYNSSSPTSKWKYMILPMVDGPNLVWSAGIRRQKFLKTGRLNYWNIELKSFKTATAYENIIDDTLSIIEKRFVYEWGPRINLKWKNSFGRNWRSHLLIENANGIDELNEYDYYIRFKYKLSKKRPRHPYKFTFKTRFNHQFLRSAASFTFTRDYANGINALKVKLFTGAYLVNFANKKYSLSTKTASEQGAYDNVFLTNANTTTDLIFDRFRETGGGFVAPTGGIGKSRSVIAAINTKLTPFKYEGISLYFNMGYAPNSGHYSLLQYEGGIIWKFHILHWNFHIYHNWLLSPDLLDFLTYDNPSTILAFDNGEDENGEAVGLTRFQAGLTASRLYFFIDNTRDKKAQRKKLYRKAKHVPSI